MDPAVLFIGHSCLCSIIFNPLVLPVVQEYLCIIIQSILHAGDHFYKENDSLPLEEQMISALPDVQTRTLTGEDEFIVIACDGIWSVALCTLIVMYPNLPEWPGHETTMVDGLGMRLVQ